MLSAGLFYQESRITSRPGKGGWMSTLWAAQGHRTIKGAFMEGSLRVYQGDHFPPAFWFPCERFSFDTPGPFLYSLLAPLFTEEAASHWSSFLSEFSHFLHPISGSRWLHQDPGWRQGRWPVHFGFHGRLCSPKTVMFIKMMLGLLLTRLFLSWSELMKEIGLLCTGFPQDLYRETESIGFILAAAVVVQLLSSV